MNDQEFKERAYANPYDKDPDFITASKQTSARQEMLKELLNFEGKISTTFTSVSAPDTLKEQLLNTSSYEKAGIQTAPKEASNDNQFWQSVISVAASLLLILGITLSFSPFPTQSNVTFERQVFAHIYHDINDLETTDNLSIEQVNQQMNSVIGSSFTKNANNFDIMMAKNCWVAKEDSIHMVMQGSTGAITVIIIPTNAPVKKAFTIADERFEGIISPTPTGNLIVVGEKQEPILEFKNLLASNISW